MSSSSEPLLADDSAQETSDPRLEKAAESLRNTASDIASSAGGHQYEYTRQVLLNISQLLKLLANKPSSPVPDLELGELDPAHGISAFLFFRLI